MSDQYYINDYETRKNSDKMTSTNNSSKRNRFDSVSTNSSCGDNSNNQQQQYDSRFEPRQVLDVQVKKSFLSSQYSNNNANTKSSISAGYSSTSLTGKCGSYLSTSSMTYQIILSIRLNEQDQYGNYNYSCFPEVEMILDDDLTVETVTREIIEKLNSKMIKDLKLCDKKAKIKNTSLLHSVNGSQKCFEISQSSKDGEPKGCSFDCHQTLRNIKCKSKICLKVLDNSAYDPIIFKLLNKKPLNTKKYDFNVYPISEQEDDLLSNVRATSHYQESFFQKEIQSGAINNPTQNSFSSKSIHSASTIEKEDKQIISQKCSFNKKSKPSLWNRIFKCGVICQ